MRNIINCGLQIIVTIKNKNMTNENYYWGMHLIWWFLWFIILIWIFAIPYDIPGQRKKDDSPIHILKKRLASGQITVDVYQEMKKILEEN